ncbi:MAG: two-component sensor histidine kinase [Saprospiraceae bacterium]|nr:MAG: two-component sensor histidine kinase [Saprospiraceae bacterium]
MNNKTITRVILLGVIALTGIIGLQSYWVTSTWDINEEDFNKKINYALYNVAKSLANINDSTLPPREIINRKTSNYYIVNLADEINSDYLEYFLQKELESLALNIDFEYAVFDCNTNEMVYGNYCNYSPHIKKDLVLGDLPKDSKFTYYFGVKFPTRSGYLFGKMQLSIFISVILLITTLFFAYSMFVILRQKRLSEMQKDFINNMTHEFKTPISTIRISADVFLNNPNIKSDPRLLQYATIIKEQNQRLNNQVEKVLQLAKIEQGSFLLKMECVNLKEILQNIGESIQMRVDKRGGDFDMDLGSQPIFVMADRLHLSNILYNLLDNAIKYCRESPHIKLRLKQKGLKVEVIIEDEGVGIPKEHQPRVFDKFFRVPTGDVHNVKGFGLGLYYVKNICDTHHWNLRLYSKQDCGTKVEIEMPSIKEPIKLRQS